MEEAAGAAHGPRTVFPARASAVQVSICVQKMEPAPPHA